MVSDSEVFQGHGQPPPVSVECMSQSELFHGIPSLCLTLSMVYGICCMSVHCMAKPFVIQTLLLPFRLCPFHVVLLQRELRRCVHYLMSMKPFVRMIQRWHRIHSQLSRRLRLLLVEQGHQLSILMQSLHGLVGPNVCLVTLTLL